METIAPPGEPQDPAPPSNDTVGRGIAIAFLCVFGYIVGGSIATALGLNLFFFLLASWGVIPLMVLIPLFLIQLKSGRSQTAKGILIFGSIAFLLNAGCDAIIRIPRLF